MTFFDPTHLGVKICGITTLADARMCIACGADALGFNFFSGSKRYIDPIAALPWIRELESPAARVAVVVNADAALLDLIREAEVFEAIQFHGDESPQDCADAGFERWIRAVRVSDLHSLEEALAYDTPHLLLDAAVAGSYGGTGHVVDWELVGGFISKEKDRQFILAGGLNAHNVKEAICRVCPAAIDVAGGVEKAPGVKDGSLTSAFIREVRDVSPTTARQRAQSIGNQKNSW